MTLDRDLRRLNDFVLFRLAEVSRNAREAGRNKEVILAQQMMLEFGEWIGLLQKQRTAYVEEVTRAIQRDLKQG